MGESLLLGLWHIVYLFYHFFVTIIVQAIAGVLFERVGLVALGVVAVLAMAAMILRARRHH